MSTMHSEPINVQAALLQIMPINKIGGATMLALINHKLWLDRNGRHSYFACVSSNSGCHIPSVVGRQVLGERKKFTLTIIKTLESLCYIRKQRIAVVIHTHGAQGNIIGSMLYVLRRAGLPFFRNVKVINHVHGAISESLSCSARPFILLRIADYISSSLCDIAIYTSPHELSLCRLFSARFAHSLQRHRIIFPAPHRRFSSFLKNHPAYLTNPPISLFFYARPSAQKNLSLFLRAAEKAISNGLATEARVFVPSSSVSQSLGSKVSSYCGISLHPDQMIDEYLLSASILPVHLVTSMYEPFSMAVLELAQAGYLSICPVFTGALSAIKLLSRYSFKKLAVGSIVESLQMLKSDVTPEFISVFADKLAAEASAYSRKLYSDKICEAWDAAAAISNLRLLRE